MSRTQALALAALVLAILAPAAPVHAERFPVSARVFCPASLELDGLGNPTAVDASFADASVLWVPCAGVKVRVMDADDEWDDVCAEAYTDSQGRIALGADCSDGLGGGSPDAYLSIEARSAFGFSIGTWDYGFWDALADTIEAIGLAVLTNGWSVVIELAGGADFPDAIVAHETAQWVSEERLGREATLVDFGDRMMGDDFSASAAPATQQEAPLWAAREFWIAHRTLAQIRPASTYRPMYFQWTVDHPWFGAPTTLWDTVIVDAARMSDPNRRDDALQATPHEIGHVIHNRYHSSYSHWIYADALQYAKVHMQCASDTLILGWYEGFGNFVEDWVFSAVAPSGALPPPLPTSEIGSVRSAGGVDWEPFAGCGQSGLALEGNNQAILNRIYHGPLDALYDLTHTPVASEYACPGGMQLELRNGNNWRCVRERTAACALSADRRLIDAQGQADVCEQDPEIGLPFQGVVLHTASLGCTSAYCIELPILSILTGAPPPAPTSSSTTVTLTPTHDANGDPIPSAPTSSQPVATPLPPADLASATRIFPPDCSLYSDPTATMQFVVRAGADSCVEDGPAAWSPPLDPAAPHTIRSDGSSRSVIARNAQGNREWFALPGLGEVIQLIQTSGDGAHRMQEHWDASIGAFCRGSDALGRSWFCNPDRSPVFGSEIAPQGLDTTP